MTQLVSFVNYRNYSHSLSSEFRKTTVVFVAKYNAFGKSVGL